MCAQKLIDHSFSREITKYEYTIVIINYLHLYLVVTLLKTQCGKYFKR